MLDKEIMVSVIVPIYNAEKYLDECLNSLTNQTLTDIEIICINDGSTDNSLQIIENYANVDDRIKIISTDNNGQGSARNLGLNVATGKFISFVDADDWIELNAYELLYKNADDKNLDMLFFQMVNFIDSTKKIIETDLYNYKCLLDNFRTDEIFSSDNTRNFLFDIAVCPVAKLYKKEFLLEYNLKFPEGVIFEDNVFFYNSYLNANRVSLLNEQLYYRRRHDESVTQNITKKAFDIVIITNKLLNLFKENGWYEFYKRSLINHTFSMILEWFFKSPLILRDEFYNKIKNEFFGFHQYKQDFFIFLNENQKFIFDLFCKHNYYLDFISEYNLSLVEYSNIIPSEDKKYKISVIIPIFNNPIIIHRTLLSIFNQTFNFDEIEIVIVDDKSTDCTPDVIDRYGNKYGNIKVIHLKENTGASGTPRNVGILESSADYIMFLDHDDFFELNAFEILYDEIIKTKSDVVFGTYAVINDNNDFSVISYPKEKHGYFNKLTDNERFVSFPPPSIWTKIFNKEFILKNNILFPPILGEDAIFMVNTLLNSEGISYLWDSLICYHDLSKNSKTNNVSLDYLIEGIVSEKYLYNLFKNIKKEYYFKYRCEGNLDFFLSQFMRSTLDYEEIIYIFNTFKWLIDKCGEYGLSPNKKDNKTLFEFFIKKDIESIYLFKNSMTNVNLLKDNTFLVDVVEIKNDIFYLSGKIRCSSNDYDLDVFLSKKINNVDKIFNFIKKDVLDNEIHDSIVSFDFEVPLIEFENSEISMFISYFKDGSPIQLNFDFNNHAKLSKVSNYSIWNNYIIQFVNNKFIISNYSYFKQIKLEINVLKNIYFGKEAYWTSAIVFRFVYLLLYLFYRNKKIWLFMDQRNKAGDNAEFLYRYSINQKDKIQKYFTISNNVADFNRLKSLKRILPFYSIKQRLIYLFSDKIISSCADEKILNPFMGKNVGLYSGLIKSDKILLLHNISIDSSHYIKNDKNIILLSSIFDSERNVYNQNNNSNVIKCLGVPRFDYLEYGRGSKQILIMPSFRLELTNMSQVQFINSDFFKKINSLINNEKLIDLAKFFNYKLIFHFSSNLMNFIDLFEKNDYVIFDYESNYSELLNNSSLLITDYSSIAFDFAYVKKPICYYHFDDYALDNMSFNYESMGFGEIVTFEEELLTIIKKYISNNCQMENVYQKRADSFFKGIGRNNCEIVYKEIRNL